MKILSGTVVAGHVELEPLSQVVEGTSVTVLVSDEESFTLSARDVAALEGSISEANRGDVVDGWDLLRQLRS